MRIKLDKGELARQREQLRLLERLLPSLDLKRRQLTVQRELERTRLAALEREREQLRARVAAELPMLADARIDLAGLVRVSAVELHEENVAAVRLPTLGPLHFATHPYTPLGRPFWVDVTVERLREACRVELELDIARERIRRVELAMRRVTQRVNLFERVMIPRTKQSIARIRLHLGETERAAVVRAKLSKQRRELAP